MKGTLAYISLTIALMLISCGSKTSIKEDIASAELSMANEDMMATRNMCEALMSRSEKTAMEASDYARLSILYMQLNERTDNPSDIEYATQCFRQAYKLNSDSAAFFYSSLPVDQEKYAMTLATIVHSLDNPREIPPEHYDVDNLENFEHHDSIDVH